MEILYIILILTMLVIISQFSILFLLLKNPKADVAKPKKNPCKGCDVELPKRELYLINGEKYCKRCFDEITSTQELPKFDIDPAPVPVPPNVVKMSAPPTIPKNPESVQENLSSDVCDKCGQVSPNGFQYYQKYFCPTCYNEVKKTRGRYK